MSCAGLLVLVALATCSPPGRPIVAEVYYDAIGDDTGQEYVELFNPTSQARSLHGARLEAGDGAGPGRWTLRWTGGPGDSVGAGGRFLIGGAAVTPAPDALATLELQNGPDAMRLVWPDGAIEVVGWGAHAFAEYACGAPTPDVASGLALARVPDGSDRGGNDLDFRPAPPSPGRVNQPARDAAAARGTLDLEPAQPSPGAPCRLSGRWVNRGATPIAAGALAAVAEAVGADGVAIGLATFTLDATVAPAESVAFAVDLAAPPAGKWRLVARARLAGDEAPENDADTLLARVGPGPLRIVEVQFHPAAGEGEWIEVANRSGVRLDLDAFTLADRNGDPGAVDGGAPLSPESLAVLAQDPAALLARYPGLDPGRVRRVHPWAALNNTDDAEGVADIAVLADIDGTPCDRVAYSAAGVPAGVPLERGDDGGLVPALDPLGTPLAPPRTLPPLAGALEVAPRRIAAGADVRMSWSLPWDARLTLELHDLAGRRVGALRPEGPAARRGEFAWRAAGLPPGLYLVTLRARAADGSATLTRTLPVRLRGSTP